MKNTVVSWTARREPVRHALWASIWLMASLAPTTAQTPDLENGRYTLSPIADGIVRLDTRTGAVSTCTDKGSGWACYVIPDERAALDAEIGRLQSETAALKAELARREPGIADKNNEALPKEALPKQDFLKPKTADGDRKIEIPKIEIPLPSDHDIDRVISAVESAWRRLVDMVGRIQRDPSGKI